MKRRLFLFFIVLVSVNGCSGDSQKPKDIIAENEYIDLLVELQLVRSYGESMEADSLTVDSLTSEVFKRYGVSAEIFQSSHNYYQQFPQEQKIRIEKAIEQLKMDQVSNMPKDTSSTGQ